MANLAIILIPFVILIMLFGGLFLLWKKGGWCKLASFFISISFIYLIITAIYPNDSFFINDFEDTTSLSLPKTVKVLHKSATYPDFHGDYSSEAIFELPKEDFQTLINKLSLREKNLCNAKRKIEMKLSRSLMIVGCQTVQRSGLYFYWNVYSDGKTIYYFYSST